MRINRFIAASSNLSRRAADQAILDGRVSISGTLATVAADVLNTDTVTLDGQPLSPPMAAQTILLNKPTGYIVSREGQGSRTVYDLLPPDMQQLKPVGRLDKDSCGLLLLTNDGELAQRLTHPSFQKAKIYEVELDKPLTPLHRQMIAEMGIQLEDGPSRLGLERRRDDDNHGWRITMHEGRNRQIRRTFAALGYTVTKLRRTQFGNYSLPPRLKTGQYQAL